MHKNAVKWPWLQWQGRSQTAWGSLLDEQDIVLAALSQQQNGGVRVLAFDHLRAPADLPDVAARDDWLVNSLRQSAQHLPRRLRTMALALREGRCRQGQLPWSGEDDVQTLEAEVQLEAAVALGVAPGQVGFDFWLDHRSEGATVHWAACLRSEIEHWQTHARKSGWRLPVIEPEHQAARRAATCLRAEHFLNWAASPQDWQFSRIPQRDIPDHDWQLLQGSAMWGALVACGAALGALM